MKKFCLILPAVLPLMISAQTLQFNQVKLITGSMETVPANKVWKIESAVYNSAMPNLVSSSGSSGNYSVQDCVMEINSSPVQIRSLRSGGGYYHASATVWEQSWPVWLTAGNTLRASTGVLCLSVIEFNIVP